MQIMRKPIGKRTTDKALMSFGVISGLWQYKSFARAKSDELTTRHDLEPQ